MKRNPKVFISYPREESSWVQGFADSLRERGVDVWFDRYEIQAGDDFRKSLEAGMRHSDGVVFLLTTPAARNPSLLFEIGAAMGMGKRVIPIVTPGMDPAAIPVDLRLRGWVVRGEPASTAMEVASALIKESSPQSASRN